jgi:hypothetical protein
MKKFNRTAKTFSTVVAGATVLALFGTGTAVAGGMITSAKIKNNTVKSIDVRDNTLKSVDVRDGALTGADVAANALNGSDIADASLTNQDVSVFYASVLANGTLDRSSGGVTISKSGAGSYKVDFNRSVRDCAFTATVGNQWDATHTEGEADISAQLLDLTAVHVYTRTAATTTEADLPFMVTAVC